MRAPVNYALLWFNNYIFWIIFLLNFNEPYNEFPLQRSFLFRNLQNQSLSEREVMPMRAQRILRAQPSKMCVANTYYRAPIFPENIFLLNV